MEFLKTWFIKGWEWICNITLVGASTAIIGTGVLVKEFAIIVVMVGVLLWMCRYTKVFRWGMIGYIIGFILELIGLLMRV